jgi:hypothetical protein
MGPMGLDGPRCVWNINEVVPGPRRGRSVEKNTIGRRLPIGKFLRCGSSESVEAVRRVNE